MKDENGKAPCLIDAEEYAEITGLPVGTMREIALSLWPDAPDGARWELRDAARAWHQFFRAQRVDANAEIERLRMERDRALGERTAARGEALAAEMIMDAFREENMDLRREIDRLRFSDVDKKRAARTRLEKAESQLLSALGGMTDEELQEAIQ